LTIAVGALLFAFSSRTFDAYIPGYMIMAMGGTFICFSVFELPTLVAEQHSGLIFSLVSGAFDASSAVMFLMQYVANQYAQTIRNLFLMYLLAPLSLLFVATWLFEAPPAPRSAVVGSNSTQSPDAATHLLRGNQGVGQALHHHDGIQRLNGQHSCVDNGWLGDDKTTLQVIFSWPFLAITIWMTFYLSAKYFYMATTNEQVLRIPLACCSNV